MTAKHPVRSCPSNAVFATVGRTLCRVTLVVACLVPAASTLAQENAPPRPTPNDRAPHAASPPDGASSAPAATQEPASAGSAVGRFTRDVFGDFKHFFSKETAYWYAGGLASAGLVHVADEDIREALEDPPEATQTALEGGDKYGNLTLQVPLAVGWWVTGRAMGSARGADAGRDLVRAQINATAWAYAIKYAVDRTRPNGDPRSFPSGHATAVFATAMVLQEHYGWKVGVPFFAGAAYTAVSRISVNKHWASDVTFGAFVGMASARTVTLHVRGAKLVLSPLRVPGGGGIALVRVN